MVKHFVFLLAISLYMVACNTATSHQAISGTPELVAVEGYQVRDVSGLFSSRVDGVVMEPHTGEIQYLAIRAPVSAFALDHSTIPALAGSDYILIPWQMVTIDPTGRSLILLAGLSELQGSPHFSDVPNQLSPDSVKRLNTYWSAILK
jgi:sporulation protein YlmC with PRC-barrel domain